MNDMLKAIQDLCHERGVDKNVILDAIEAALVVAYKKNYYKGKNDAPNVLVEIDRKSGGIHVYAQKTVVEEVLDPREEISLEDAREISPDCELEDTVNIEVTPKDFGRMSAMAAKQVVTQRIREAEHGIVYSDRGGHSPGMLIGTVMLPDEDRVYVNIDKYDQMEAYLPKKEQSAGEVYEPGDRMHFYVIDIKSDTRNPRLILSRTHPELVRQLFEAVVPEIGDGIVEIKGIAREGGSRTKIAVYSTNPEIDPQGACIGQKGARVREINRELKAEKIDIIRWSENPAEFIAASLAPAQVLACDLDEETHMARVIVPDSQLSLAIGKSGQNVRLAARLTGWKIDIKSDKTEQEPAE